ncbi:hypothetical protein BDR26DRAFT_849999 [Obelidium mucronatum]|nr:hypothetical protein BDR26DRAFT_849999 [Obelidium mucronatum]
MVAIEATAGIKSAIEDALARLKSKEVSVPGLEERLRDWATGELACPRSISHSLVQEVSQLLLSNCEEEDSKEKYAFKALTKGSRMVLDSPKARVKSPELIELLRKAKIIAENAGLVPKHKMTQLTKQERNEYNATIGMFSGILNVLLSMLACVHGSSRLDIGMKTLLALFFALVVGFAEGWFFSRDWLFEDRQVKKDK